MARQNTSLNKFAWLRGHLKWYTCSQAVLYNCKNPNFIFITELKETEFYRRIYGLEQAGLIQASSLPEVKLPKVTRVSITLSGWEIINQVYNNSGLSRGLGGASAAQA
jgi:hypothetical protein